MFSHKNIFKKTKKPKKFVMQKIEIKVFLEEN